MNCPDCGAKLIHMISSSFCPNDCDRKDKQTVTEAEPGFFYVAGLPEEFFNQPAARGMQIRDFYGRSEPFPKGFIGWQKIKINGPYATTDIQFNMYTCKIRVMGNALIELVEEG